MGQNISLFTYVDYYFRLFLLPFVSFGARRRDYDSDTLPTKGPRKEWTEGRSRTVTLRTPLPVVLLPG